MLVLVAGLAAGCGGATPSGPGIATLASPDPSGTPAPSASPAASADPQQAMVDYARCMREHGVDMPDPVFNGAGGGGVVVQGSASSGTASAPDQSEMSTADTACRHFLDSITLDSSKGEISQEMKDAMLAFSRCMRDHGVDMPDPVFSGGGASLQFGGPGASSIDPSSSDFQEAQATCQKLLPAPAEGGPGFSVGGPPAGGAAPADGGSGPSLHVAVPAPGGN